MIIVIGMLSWDILLLLSARVQTIYSTIYAYLNNYKRYAQLEWNDLHLSIHGKMLAKIIIARDVLNWVIIVLVPAKNNNCQQGGGSSNPHLQFSMSQLCHSLSNRIVDTEKNAFCIFRNLDTVNRDPRDRVPSLFIYLIIPTTHPTPTTWRLLVMACLLVIGCTTQPVLELLCLQNNSLPSLSSLS